MRVHIDIDEELLRRIDAAAGERGRSEFVRAALAAALERSEMVRRILEAKGAISDGGHQWDDDPAGWVRAQRRAEGRRVG